MHCGSGVMTYPRSCPLCRAAYAGASGDLDHVTLHAEPGGTPSSRFPDVLGRVLTLHCQLCGGEYRWDFFADAAPPGAAVVPTRRAGRRAARRQPFAFPPRRSSP